MTALVLLLVLAQPKPPEVPTLRVKAYDDYGKAYKEAVKLNLPLLVWVGQRPRYAWTAKCVSVYQPAFEGYPATCVIISKPKDGSMWWSATLEGKPTDYDIDTAIIPKQASLVRLDDAIGGASEGARARQGGAPPVLVRQGPAVRSSRSC